MQLGNFIDVLLAGHVSGTYTHKPHNLNLHHEPPLHTPLPQPGEHKPPVPTQTDLYNTP